MKTLKLSEAGQELTRLTLALYRANTYRRAHELLAKNLIDTSVEAGGLISLAAEASRADVAEAAARASESVVKIIRLVDLMRDEGVYTERQIKPVRQLALATDKALKQLAAVKPADARPSAPAAKPVPAPAEERDEDGFNDVYQAI